MKKRLQLSNISGGWPELWSLYSEEMKSVLFQITLEHQQTTTSSERTQHEFSFYPGQANIWGTNIGKPPATQQSKVGDPPMPEARADLMGKRRKRAVPYDVGYAKGNG